STRRTSRKGGARSSPTGARVSRQGRTHDAGCRPAMWRFRGARRMTPLFVAQIVLTLFVFFMLLNSAAVMVYVERKVAALMQQRLGPYLVGPKGMLQPLADVIKLMFKEELRPMA